MSETAHGSAGAMVRLELTATSLSIAVGRAVIRRIVTFRDSDAESSFLVAFTEIMANAVDEHARLPTSDPIVVEIEQTPDEVVRVADSGSGMVVDPSTAVPDGPVEHGRGLALARAFVGGIDFESTSTGTTVTLPLTGFGIIR